MLSFVWKLARILLLVVVVRYVILWIQWFFFRDRARVSHRSTETVTGETRRDPVCGTFVSTELSLRAFQNGREEHFCSEECREKYLAGHALSLNSPSV